jgi:hypothetical protein
MTIPSSPFDDDHTSLDYTSPIDYPDMEEINDLLEPYDKTLRDLFFSTCNIKELPKGRKGGSRSAYIPLMDVNTYISFFKTYRISPGLLPRSALINLFNRNAQDVG